MPAFKLKPTDTDTFDPNGPKGNLKITAIGPGLWAENLQVGLQQSAAPADPKQAHASFVVLPPATVTNQTPLETIPNIPLLEPDGQTAVSAAQIATTITTKSSLVTAKVDSNASDTGAKSPAPLAGGSDGAWPTDAATYAKDFAAEVEAVLAVGAPLDQIAPAVFNIMCIPDLALLDSVSQESVFTTAHGYCEARQAFLLVDPPGPTGAAEGQQIAVDQIGAPPDPTATETEMAKLTGWATDFLSPEHVAAATYYPWVQIDDPVTALPRYVPPSGTIAGVYAATDTSRGVWKAPAGIEALLGEVSGLADTTINDTVNGDLNALGSQLPAHVPAVRLDRLGGQDAGRQRHRRQSVQVRIGPPADRLHRAESEAELALGGVRAECGRRCGRRSRSR